MLDILGNIWKKTPEPPSQEETLSFITSGSGPLSIGVMPFGKCFSWPAPPGLPG